MHVKQVRHERPQAVGLLLYKHPEQASPPDREQPGGYQGLGQGRAYVRDSGDTLDRGAAVCTDLDTVCRVNVNAFF